MKHHYNLIYSRCNILVTVHNVGGHVGMATLPELGVEDTRLPDFPRSKLRVNYVSSCGIGLLIRHTYYLKHSRLAMKS